MALPSYAEIDSAIKAPAGAVVDPNLTNAADVRVVLKSIRDEVAARTTVSEVHSNLTAGAALSGSQLNCVVDPDAFAPTFQLKAGAVDSYSLAPDLTFGNPSNQDAGEQRTTIGFYRADGALRALLGVKWQDADNNPVEQLQVSYNNGETWQTIGFTPVVVVNRVTGEHAGYESLQYVLDNVALNANYRIELFGHTTWPSGANTPAEIYMPGFDLTISDGSEIGFGITARNVICSGKFVVSGSEIVINARILAVIDCSNADGIRLIGGGRGAVIVKDSTAYLENGNWSPADGAGADDAVLTVTTGGVGTIYLRNATVTGRMDDFNGYGPGRIIDLDRRGRSTPIAFPADTVVLDLTTEDDAVETVRIATYGATPVNTIIGYATPHDLTITSNGTYFELGISARAAVANDGAVLGQDGNNYPIEFPGDRITLRPTPVTNDNGTFRCWAVVGYSHCD